MADRHGPEGAREYQPTWKRPPIVKGASVTREDLAGDVVMIYDDHGNAYTAFDYTPEALRQHARELERALGESTTVTYGPSPFLAGGPNG